VLPWHRDGVKGCIYGKEQSQRTFARNFETTKSPRYLSALNGCVNNVQQPKFVMEPTSDELFALMDMARNDDESESPDTRVDCTDAPSDTTSQNNVPVVVHLENGQVHVCQGFNCRFLAQSRDVDKSWYCQLSGRVICTPLEAAPDSSWTGRSCGSADPDMNSGAVNTAAWRNKRTAFAASAAAYSRVNEMATGDVEAFELRAVAEPRAIKRGAPCVVDVDDDAVNLNKRAKAAKRETSLQSRDVQVRLIADATTVVQKLFTVLSSAGRTPKKQDCSASVAPATSTIADPRLENFDFVLKMALKRYVARCKHTGALPSLSGVHDVAAATNLFVKERQREATARRQLLSTRRVALNGRTVELCSSLIFTLWMVMCSTTYFMEHQTGDSFRPFAAGVMYALKRGVRLSNGMVVVPVLQTLASQLPELRSTTVTPAARQLQQASHKGLCALHRGIASIEQMDAANRAVADDRLRVATRIASALVRYVETAAKEEARLVA
jgi:hypothetical protein